MFGLNTKAANGTEGGPRYVERVARLLSEDLDLAPEPVLIALEREADREQLSEQPAECLEPRFEEPASPDSETLATGSKAATEERPAEPQEASTLSLEEGTRRIAEALWRLAQDPQGAREREEKQQQRLAEAFEAISRVSGELGGLNSDIAGVHSALRSGSQRESEVRATVSSLEDRCRQNEAGLQSTQEQVREFRSEAGEQARNLRSATESLEARLAGLSGAIEGLERSLRTYAEAAGTLNSRWESLSQAHASLQERHSEQALVIEQLQADNAHTGSLMDNLVASLRGLDGRAERRRGVDKEVKVVMIGETDASIHGHIIDASETGLGLRLSAAVPVGSRIQLDVDGALFAGEVAHCKRRGEWYTAGLKSARRIEVRAS